MKKYIKQIFLLALFVAFTSCTDNSSDDINMPAASGRPVLGASSNPVRVGADSRIANTDTAKILYIYTFLKEGVTLKSLVVYNNTAATGPVVVGTKVSDTTISTDGTTASFNSSTLSGNPAFNGPKDKTIRLALVATFSDGLTLTNGAVLTVRTPTP